MTDIDETDIRRLRAEVHTLREEKEVFQHQLPVTATELREVGARRHELLGELR